MMTKYILARGKNKVVRLANCSLIAVFLLTACLSLSASGQSYQDSILEYRKKYISELVGETGGPLKPSQSKGITFFQPDKSYRVWADFEESPGTVPFMVPTHSGKSKPYKEYGTLTFYIHDSLLVLHVYQSMELLKNAAYKSYLFLPFRDMTNYDATYGGGRYIDLKLDEVNNGKVLLDFNKAYNPYCAYAEGYSCPIPPEENRLRIEIPAGEKMFTP